MGAVLTSRSARDMIIEDPGGFCGYFGLTGDESAVLAAMAGDLTALMPGFVNKRERSLRTAFPVTLELLGDLGTPLVEDYSDMHAPTASLTEDTLRFGDFLLERTQERAAQARHGALIHDVNRYEQLRLRCCYTEGPLWPARETDPIDPQRIARDRGLWPHRSLSAGRFRADVRTVRTPRDLPRTRLDPANLLFVQRDADGQVIVLRVDDEGARAVELLLARPGELSAAAVTELASPGRSPEELLGKLIAQGVISGARS
jgi:hypothetical protein